MKVDVSKFDVGLQLGNNGITFAVYENDGTYAGKLRVGKATIEWCSGKTKIGNGHKFELSELVAYLGKAGGGKKALKPKK